MKVLILAGGFGTRLSEETAIRPKPMVEIGGKPILWHIMKYYSHYGYNEFVILLGYKGSYIKDYFTNYILHNSSIKINTKSNSIEILDNNSEAWDITLLDTGINTMTGGRIKRAQKIVGDAPFMLTYGDGVCDVNIDDLVKFHQGHKGSITMTTVQPEGRFGTVVSDSENKINHFKEKPPGEQGWINGGFFVCDPEVFNYIPDDDTIIFERDPLENLAVNHELFAFKHHGFWKAMDSLNDKKNLNKIWETGNAKWKKWN